MVHPAAVRVSNDAGGRPRIDSIAGDGPTPSISLAHTERGAVAVAADRPVGIDLEEIEAGARLTPEDFATDAERALLGRLADEPAAAPALTRLWCAKEAAGKMLGTGLAGRPKDLEAVAVERDGRFEIRHRPTDRRVEVWTETFDGAVVAVAAPARVVTGRSS
jgi:phosphopantetheinyl transferase